MNLLITFDDGDTVQDLYYAKLSNGKVAIKWDPDATYYRLISIKKFDAMKKAAQENDKLVQAAEFNL